MQIAAARIRIAMMPDQSCNDATACMARRGRAGIHGIATVAPLRGTACLLTHMARMVAWSARRSANV